MSEFVYKPPNHTPPIAQNATIGVKFARQTRILDPWHIIGGTKWTRTLFRLRHPIIYSKRGLRNIYRRIKRKFVKDPPMILARRWVNKEDLLHLYPTQEQIDHGNNQKQKNIAQQDQGSSRKRGR